MSTNTILKSSAIAAITLAGLSVTASANAQSSRYGNVYDYESGRNCGQACVAPAPMGQTSSRYGNAVTHTAPMHVAPGPIYVDCAQMGTCAPQPTTVYTQPAPVQYQAAPTYTQAPANCPAGTTAQADGTCMQGSFGSSTTYSTPTTSYGSSSYSSSSSVMTSMPADCPAGTTAQSDGTCLQGSTSYSAPTLPDTYDSFGSSSSYSSSTYSSSTTAPANCPAGTTAQSDGTCMQGGSVSSYTGSSVELYTGDASATGTTSYGYTSEGTYTATDYLPIRK